MAWYIDEDHVHHVPASGPAWSQSFGPGSKAVYSGVYRCTACAHEIVANGGEHLPGDQHHLHMASESDLGWKLLVLINITGA